MEKLFTENDYTSGILLYVYMRMSAHEMKLLTYGFAKIIIIHTATNGCDALNVHSPTWALHTHTGTHIRKIGIMKISPCPLSPPRELVQLQMRQQSFCKHLLLPTKTQQSKTK